MSASFLDDLNPQQRQAVEAGNGPVMIVAGPGTGKTKTLVARLAFLLAQGVAPEQILALTFTHKAAREMRERVAGVAREGAMPAITTFHGLSYDLLGKDDGRVFVSEAERLALIRALKKPKDLVAFSTRELALRLGRHKNAIARDDETMAELAQSYSEALRAKGLRDFDDLLIDTYELLQARPEMARYDYVLVDELQDTSDIQYVLAKRLAANGNLFVIGDPRQSIYGFRGASGGVFEQFRADFPAAREVVLRTNYRSARAIVATGNAIFPGVELSAWASELGSVNAMQTLNEYSEADWVVSEIERGMGGTDFLRVDSGAEGSGAKAFRDFAVIYRTHRASKALQRRLDESGLPYQVVGGGSVYERPEIVQLLEALRAESDRRQTQLFEVEAEAVTDMAARLAEQLGLGDNEPARLELNRFLGVLVRFGENLSDCLEYFDELGRSDYYDPAADAITLLTIHAAKGLEFEHVFVCGAEEGLIPHLRSDDEEHIAEERRLFYVAATRARVRLDLMHAKYRGGARVERSRFLEGLPMEYSVDPAMAQLEKKRIKQTLKRAQGTLF